MIVLQLIGPTGVGKSHWGKWLVEDINQKAQAQLVSFYDLDHLIETPSHSAEAVFLNYGPHYFWERSLQMLERLHQSSHLCVVATGAGTQWAACHLGLHERLLAFPTCTLWCTPTFLLTYLKLKRGDQRSLEALQNTEYSMERTWLYKQGFQIDRTSLSEPQLKAALKATYLFMKDQGASH
jgi:shikimate kinase